MVQSIFDRSTKPRPRTDKVAFVRDLAFAGFATPDYDPEMSRLLLSLLFLALPALAQDRAEDWEQLPRVPDRIEVVKDDLGFYWQLTGAGSFYSMGANTFKSANMLAINGVNFTANAVFKNSETRYAFEANLGQLAVRRDIWIDQARGGVRYVESLKNTTAAPISIQVSLKTDFSYAWQDVLSDSGKPLAGQLGARDAGAFFRFSPADGQSDVWILAGGEKADVMPKMTLADARQVVLVYDVSVPANDEVSIVHWIGQRSLTDLAELRAQFDPFYNRGRLVRANLPQQQLAAGVRNFAANPDSAPAAEAFDPVALVGLNRLLDRLEAERTGKELLYLSHENQLSGDVSPGVSVKIETELGEAAVPLAEIAALRGGGGTRRRLHEIYTRDGDLLIGQGALPTTRMSGADGWEMDLNLNELETLLLRVAEIDGKPAEGVWGYAELDDGQILALADGENAKFSFVTPWGAPVVELADVVALHPADAAASPRSQLTLRDGSQLLGFASGDPISLQSSRLGAVEIQGSRIRAIWRIGSNGMAPAPIEDLRDDWDATADFASSLVWLEGGSRVAAELADAELALVTENQVTPLALAEIVSLRRTEDGILDRLPFFEVELKNGDLISGRLRNREVRIEARGEVWRVPLGHFLGYRRSS